MVEHKSKAYNISSGSMTMIEKGTLKHGDAVQFWIIGTTGNIQSIIPDFVCLLCPHCGNYGDAGSHPHIQNKHVLQFRNEVIDLSNSGWAHIEVLENGVVVPNVVALNTKTMEATLRGVTAGGQIGEHKRQLKDVTFRFR